MKILVVQFAQMVSTRMLIFAHPAISLVLSAHRVPMAPVAYNVLKDTRA